MSERSDRVFSMMQANSVVPAAVPPVGSILYDNQPDDEAKRREMEDEATAGMIEIDSLASSLDNSLQAKASQLAAELQTGRGMLSNALFAAVRQGEQSIYGDVSKITNQLQDVAALEAAQMIEQIGTGLPTVQKKLEDLYGTQTEGYVSPIDIAAMGGGFAGKTQETGSQLSQSSQEGWTTLPQGYGTTPASYPQPEMSVPDPGSPPIVSPSSPNINEGTATSCWMPSHQEAEGMLSPDYPIKWIFCGEVKSPGAFYNPGLNISGITIRVFTAPGGDCAAGMAYAQRQLSFLMNGLPATTGVYTVFCGPANPSTTPTPVPSPAPTPPPPTPTPEPPPQPPTEGGCLKICDFPPKDGNKPCPPQEKFDKCKECDGTLWFNKKTCEVKVFIVGCGPPRTELNVWIEIGSSSDPKKLLELIKKHCGLPDDGKPRVPGPGGGLPPIVVDVAKLCVFLPTAGDIISLSGLGVILDLLAELFEAILRPTLGNLVPGSGPIITAFVQGVRIVGTRADAWLTEWVNAFAGAQDCGDPRRFNLLLTQVFIGIIDKYISTGFGDVFKGVQIQSRYACPTDIPSLADTSGAWLRNQIDDATYNCWIRGNNQRPEWYERITKAGQTQLNASELVIARLRNEIGEQEFNTRLRNIGFIDPELRKLVYTLSEYRPGPSDIIRMMIRDVADEPLMAKLKIDDDFPQKYIGKLKEYAEHQHIPEQILKYYWRASKSIPSPTQLGEMWQRLRDLPAGDDARVTKDDIVAALKQQDIPPFWIEKFMALLNRPLTRIDLGRLVEVGLISDSDAIIGFHKLGYDDENAERLYRLRKQLALTRASKHSAVKRVANGELNLADLRDILKSEGATEEQIYAANNRARLETSAKRRKICVASIRKRYMLGEMSRGDLELALNNVGVSADIVPQLADAFACELASRGKQLPANTLGSWYEQHLITRDEFFNRLVRVGYSSDDAIRVIRMADIRIQRKLAAEELKAMQDRLKAAKREEKEPEQDRKALEASQKQAISELKRRQATAVTQESTLASIANKMANKLSITLEDARPLVNIIYDRIYASKSLQHRELLALMAEAVDNSSVEGWTTLEAATLALALERRFVAPQPSLDEV